MADTSAIVTKPELADDPPADDAEDDEPDPADWPTAPLIAITRPAIGAVSVASARFVSSLASVCESVVT